MDWPPYYFQRLGTRGRECEPLAYAAKGVYSFNLASEATRLRRPGRGGDADHCAATVSRSSIHFDPFRRSSARLQLRPAASAHPALLDEVDRFEAGRDDAELGEDVEPGLSQHRAEARRRTTSASSSPHLRVDRDVLPRGSSRSRRRSWSWFAQTAAFWSALRKRATRFASTSARAIQNVSKHGFEHTASNG